MCSEHQLYEWFKVFSLVVASTLSSTVCPANFLWCSDHISRFSLWLQQISCAVLITVQGFPSDCSKHPELYKWFKEFLGHKESGNASETIPQGATKERSVRDEYNMEIGMYL